MSNITKNEKYPIQESQALAYLTPMYYAYEESYHYFAFTCSIFKRIWDAGREPFEFPNLSNHSIVFSPAFLVNSFYCSTQITRSFNVGSLDNASMGNSECATMEERVRGQRCMLEISFKKSYYLNIVRLTPAFSPKSKPCSQVQCTP